MSARRNWPDHISIGREISVLRGGVSEPVKIVDVKAGPMLATIDYNATEIPMHGTLKLKVKPVAGGDEFWLPPTDGQKIVDWCERKDAELSKESP